MMTGEWEKDSCQAGIASENAIEGYRTPL